MSAIVFVFFAYLMITVITYLAAPKIFRETMGDEDNFTFTALAWPISLTAGFINESMYRANLDRWRRGKTNCYEDISLFKNDTTYNMSPTRYASLKIRWEENIKLDRHTKALGTGSAITVTPLNR